MIDLTGKTALVTGGTRGIGRACALRLAEAGADVIVNYLTSQTAANEVAEQIQQMGCRAATVKADIGEDDDVQEMLHFVEERFEGLDILVSNAATGGFRMLMDSKPQHFEAAMNTNTRALISLTQAARSLLERKEGRSKVIALSSHGSRLGLPAYGLIGASKAALESLVRSLAFELGNAGINFNVVLAGLGGDRFDASHSWGERDVCGGPGAAAGWRSGFDRRGRCRCGFAAVESVERFGPGANLSR